MLLGDGVGDVDLELVPVLILGVAHTLHVLRIVGMIVDGGHRADLVEAHDEHALVIQIGESHGAVYGVHALLARPLFDGGEEGVDHLLVVDKVHEAEASAVLIPDAVSGVRNDARDASDDAFAPIGQIVDGFAILEGRVFISRQGDHLFVDQPRHIVGVALVQVDGKLHEAPELALGRDLPDGYAHKDIYMCMMKSVWWAAKVGQFVGVPWGRRRGVGFCRC